MTSHIQQQYVKEKKVLILGLGEMGSAVATNLAENQKNVKVNLWNRTYSKAKELEKNKGLSVLESLEEALNDSHLIINVLSCDSKTMKNIFRPYEKYLVGKNILQFTTLDLLQVEEMNNYYESLNMGYLDGEFVSSSVQVLAGKAFVVVSGKQETFSFFKEIIKNFGNVEYFSENILAAKTVGHSLFGVLYSSIFLFMHSCSVIKKSKVCDLKKFYDIFFSAYPTAVSWMKILSEQVEENEYSGLKAGSTIKIDMNGYGHTINILEQIGMNCETHKSIYGIMKKAYDCGFGDKSLAKISELF